MSRSAFTLVEIMIVVVIIGLLAALAVPAFKKVRNKSIETSMMNDARQVAAAAQIYATENASATVPVRSLAQALPNLSPGTILIDGNSVGPWGTKNGTLGSADYAALVLQADGTFGLINEGYLPALSGNPAVPAASYGNGLRFSVSSGQLASW